MLQTLNLTPELIGRAIDKITLNKALVFIIAVAAAGFFFDSFDIVIVSYALPLIKQEFNLDPKQVGFQWSFDFVIMVVLGGLGSISGAAIAAIILTLLPELLRDPPDLWPWGLVGAAVLAGLVAVMAPKPRRPLLTLAGLCVAWKSMRWFALWRHIDLTTYRVPIYALSLIVIMIARPQGLFGLHELWDFLPASLRRWERQRGPAGLPLKKTEAA